MSMRTQLLRSLASGALVALAATSAGVAGAGPAGAGPLDSGRIADHIDEEFDCNGTPTHQVGDVSGGFTFVQHGSEFGYYRESVHGTVAFTNLDTGGTYSNRFTQTTKDQRITDNGDGTITIVTQGSGQSSWYDKDGAFVLKDSGMFRFSVDIDLHGTTDEADDTEVPGSGVLLVPRTGRADTADNDFCDDLVRFTT